MSCLPALILTLTLLLPQGLRAEGPRFDPQDGETVVFLGDSITHQCLYTQYIETFYYTRYPERRIRFYNAGVRGDSAADCLARFDADVAAQAPDYVTVLLGMNDGGYEGLNEERFRLYQENMTALLDRIEAIGAQPVLLLPTQFDHRQEARQQDNPEFRFRGKEFAPEYNGMMALYGAWLREVAYERRLLMVDFWSALNRHTFELRQEDPEATLIQDAIHPGPAGQVIMAFEFVNALEQNRRRAGILSVMSQGESWRTSGTTEATVRRLEGGGLALDCRSSGLPWAVPERASLQEQVWELPVGGTTRGFRLAKAGHKMSAEVLKVVGLPPGRYRVSSGDREVGEFSHAILGSKIELQERDTEARAQALAVARLNREKNDEVMRPIRDVWQRLKGQRRKLSREDFATALEAAQPELEALELRLQDYEDRLYRLAQPKPQTLRIEPITGSRSPQNRAQ